MIAFVEAEQMVVAGTSAIDDGAANVLQIGDLRIWHWSFAAILECVIGPPQIKTLNTSQNIEESVLVGASYDGYWDELNVAADQ